MAITMKTKENPKETELSPRELAEIINLLSQLGIKKLVEKLDMSALEAINKETQGEIYRRTIRTFRKELKDNK